MRSLARNKLGDTVIFEILYDEIQSNHLTLPTGCGHHIKGVFSLSSLVVLLLHIIELPNSRAHVHDKYIYRYVQCQYHD